MVLAPVLLSGIFRQTRSKLIHSHRSVRQNGSVRIGEVGSRDSGGGADCPYMRSTSTTDIARSRKPGDGFVRGKVMRARFTSPRRGKDPFRSGEILNRLRRVVLLPHLLPCTELPV